MYAQLSHSVVSDTVRPHGLWPAGLLCPWGSLGKKTAVGCHALLQGTFLTQGLNLGLLRLLHWQADSLPLILGQGVAFFLRLWVCVLSRSVVSDSL